MTKLKNFIKNHQQQIVLTIGYLLVASLGFGLGRLTTPTHVPPEIKVEQVFNSPSNYTSNVSGVQTEATAAPVDLSCNGKIKGSSSRIYHLPGGSYYNKTTKPTRCFDTETEAQAAGFRKSAK